MKKIFCFVLFLFTISYVFGQQTAVPNIFVPIDSLGTDSDNLQLAISSRNYPVTPGDVYNLTFIMAGNPINNTLLVESDYTINLDILGKIDAKGMTFPELKPVIELIISDAYPRSMPSLTIQTTGSFQVSIIGAVEKTVFPKAWGLSRLSDIIEEYISDLSSIRNVKIKSVDDMDKKYDLFKAYYLGEIEQDPYLKPGDIISISSIGSVVEIKGSVMRPGRYEILEGESSADILAFSGGPTAAANISRIRIEHLNTENPITEFVTMEVLKDGIPLQHGDIISIWELRTFKKVVYIEGGIEEKPENESQSQSQQVPINSTVETKKTMRISHPIGIGDTVFDVISGYEEQLSDFADLEHAYIIRENERNIIPVNLDEMINHGMLSENVALVPNDRIAIPILEPYVNVIGAIFAPGRLPYTPPELAEYYIHRAGGINETMNSQGKYIVTDQNGFLRSLEDPIQAGDTIKVLNNNFWYNFSQRFGPITTAALFITSAITLVNVLNNN